MKTYSKKFIVFCLFVTKCSLAMAIDSAPISEKYSLVGIIANGSEAKKHKGIAVIKDAQTKRSLTVAVGDKLPYSAWQVQSIERDRVIVGDGTQSQEVRYGLSEPTEVKAPEVKAVEAQVGQVFAAPALPLVPSEAESTQPSWDQFYKGRNDGEDFDRRVTIVVGDGKNLEPYDHSNIGAYADPAAVSAPAETQTQDYKAPEFADYSDESQNDESNAENIESEADAPQIPYVH